MQKLRVYIISQEEPFYIPKVIRHVIEQQGEAYEVVGATRLKPHRKNKSMKDWFFERTKIYTYWELFLTSILFIYCKVGFKLLEKLGAYNPYAVRSVYKHNGVKEIATEDINDKAFLEKLRNLKVDVILSISPPQLFAAELINLPNKYCLNAHGTLLPRHRGVFGSWWMLFEGDKEIGTTIHTMEERLDAGEIVWQKAIETPEKATQYSIAYHTKKIMAHGLVEVLRSIHDDNTKVISPQYEQSYHRAPTKELGKEFHAKGLRVINGSNFKMVLAKSF